MIGVENSCEAKLCNLIRRLSSLGIFHLFFLLRVLIGSLRYFLYNDWSLKLLWFRFFDTDSNSTPVQSLKFFQHQQTCMEMACTSPKMPFAQPSPLYLQYMYLSRVLVGEYTVGRQGLVTPQQKSQSDSKGSSNCGVD